MRIRSLCTALMLGLSCSVVSAQPSAEVQTVPKVDLERYVGKWYEIANFPMFFQRKCVGDTTAEYAANADGTIAVKNRCREEDGTFNEADGTATVVENSGNAKLEVSFFKPFKGDYWVIGLDPEYKWSVVGAPNRKYLWILSRTPTLDAASLEQALAAAKAQGYTFEELRYTKQDGKTSEPTSAPK